MLELLFLFSLLFLVVLLLRGRVEVEEFVEEGVMVLSLGNSIFVKGNFKESLSRLDLFRLLLLLIVISEKFRSKFGF